MKYVLVGLGVAAVLGAGVGAAATAAPDRCEVALTALNEQRGAQVGTRAAYQISVENGWAGHVARLGPAMIAGEAETSRLLAAMYEAC